MALRAIATRMHLYDDFSEHDLAKIEETTQELGRHVFAHLSHRQPRIIERRWWDDRIMAWAMADESVKIQMFRFVDVLPMLRSTDAVVNHLREYFEEVRAALPTAVRLSLNVARPGTIAGRALAIAARRNAIGQARRFIAGANLNEVLVAAKRERKLNRAFTLDLLGEAVTSEAEADRYFQSYLEMVSGIAPVVNAWPESPQIDRATLQVVPRVNVSLKLSALDSQFDAIDPIGSARRVKSRLRKLLRLAREHRAHVHIDMESYKTKDLTLTIFQEILLEDEFRETEDVGIVIQAYLRDSLDDLTRLRDWARARGKPVWVRLVKGAYWDYETVFARSTGWPSPVYEQKWRSDANFERCARFLVRNHAHLRPAFGSHNIRSLAHSLAAARHVGVPPSALEVQMLYGMGDIEKQAFVDLGYRVRIYMPFGELIPGMAYLVRRLLENTSNDSFLRASFSEQIPVEQLLMNPLRHAAGDNSSAGAPANRSASASMIDAVGPTPPAKIGRFAADFQNEPPLDFAIESRRTAMQKALAGARREFGKFYPLFIDGAPVETALRHASLNPSHSREIVGYTAVGNAETADLAVAAAKRAWPAWAAIGAEGRATHLRALAAAMRERRYELAAWTVHECGKGWREADADVCEAIDFCEFYAAGAIAMQSPQGVDVPGEENRFDYLPRGVTAVIAPWNFPLAILTGMTVAALATGNTVVMKPAEQSAVVGAKLMELCQSASLPAGVVNYLPGPGEVVGATLVEHRDVAVIAFTGSRQVGLAINARAAQVSTTGAAGIKRVIAELGGKNAIIVDDDADLDEAVLGVVKSAFGYQGQKCSACSRAIVVGAAHEPFLQRLIEAARSLKIGPAEDPATSVGPVIDAESLARIRGYIRLGEDTATPMLAVDADEWTDEGFYVGPHIFANVAADSRLAQEEIFGPVLAVIRAENLDEAIRILNGTDYALTGGIFSRSPAHLERARRELLVGNLYLNRGITGALVGRQPFGGFKMSGIGSKAGGPDYLLQFVVPRTITENTMRRGFAPPTDAES